MYSGDAPGAVCVMNFCSFLAIKGSEGSAFSLGLGCAGSCRHGCGGRALPGGTAGGRAAQEGAGGSNTQRDSPKEVEVGAEAPLFLGFAPDLG